MKRTWMIGLLCLCGGAGLLDEARADVVSDRVFLSAGGVGTCSANASGFRRIRQQPDGSQTVETGEFQVPSGHYLEITSVEYTTPYFTRWAKDYVQSVEVMIRQRSGTSATSVLSARYQNGSVFAEDGSGNYDAIGEVVSPGAQTRAVAFPVGPLMSPSGRLCAAAASNFWLFAGSVRVRGRLIPSGDYSAPTTTTKGY